MNSAVFKNAPRKIIRTVFDGFYFESIFAFHKVEIHVRLARVRYGYGTVRVRYRYGYGTGTGTVQYTGTLAGREPNARDLGANSKGLSYY